ncbi:MULTISPECIES: OmpA family protein [unclassified Arcicella]|uniref:OmpA family protein n=1 Tax=unclassified Arcicella TaxID=2644986 RepID=UPI002865E9BE|nr:MULTISPECIES: OmpA family protein [unclassified Arcicella]MDR6564047.1 outer membrane protein OmpA-like peptidoglycan-associated protein [Arcicella sp. BE51]MDR6813800.1 outer membrane protein OmpA-like peptidoglycan-associated protein [Arcicella sp. BE140]MDR6825112.1 outer membrane protein OmpA-like peptidoglycan-associated protein [Arcicella sp. BE139]
MRIFFLLLFFLISFIATAQKTFWASKVVAFSSEYSDAKTTKENRAIQVLGKPSKLPQVGISACAWQPLTQNNTQEEFLIVSFDTLMPIQQVAIAENYGQGSIVRVEAFDEFDNLKTLWINRSAPSNEIGKMLNLVLSKPTPYKVRSIKIVLNTTRTKGWTQIDAIGISQATTPIKAVVNVAKNLPAAVLKENLGSNINSAYREIAPVISPDGKTLYYTRWEHPENLGKDKNQDIWYSELQNDRKWSMARPMSAPINNTEHNAICAISPDGKTILLNNVYLKDGSMLKGVSMSTKNDRGWDFPKALAIKNFNNKSDYAEYSFSPNGRVLILTGQFRETNGGKDIYLSFQQPDGTWSEPVNAGKVINTAEDEGTPFIAADGKTLYYSTRGLSGYGSSDIFVTRRLDDTWLKWSEPENLGAGINTPEWDGYFSVSALGDYAYYSSQENSIGDEDIFKFKVPESIKPETVIQLTGGVFNFADKKLIDAKIKVQSLTDADTVCVTFDPQTGDYKLMLPAKKTYSISASKKGFMPFSEILDFSKENNFKEIKKNIFLLPIEAGQRMTLNSVFFEQSKFDILPNSYPELDRIVVVMKENPTMEIMLEGHTDNQGDWNANLTLSKQRVEEVKKYLADKGVDMKRIQTQGYGSTRPVASNNSEEKRKFNRRVEFMIVKN